jgi:SNF2 family DNA or RNA helicase
MKGKRTIAIVDTDSDGSDDDNRSDIESGKLHHSMSRLKLDGDDDNYDDSDEDTDDDDDRTVDLSLPGMPEKTLDDDAVATTPKEAFVKQQSVRKLFNSSSSLSDGSNLGEENDSCKNDESKKIVATFRPGRATYNILDESSSSSSDDDSFVEFLHTSSRPKKHGSTFASKKWQTKGRGIADSPPPRRIQLDNAIEDDTSDSEDDASVKEDHASKRGWSFNKIRLEFSFQEDEDMPAFSLPSKLYEMLYDFQKDGVKWMAGLHNGKIGGTEYVLFATLMFKSVDSFPHFYL